MAVVAGVVYAQVYMALMGEEDVCVVVMLADTRVITTHSPTHTLIMSVRLSCPCCAASQKYSSSGDGA